MKARLLRAIRTDKRYHLDRRLHDPMFESSGWWYLQDMKTGKSMRRKELKLALLDYISVLKFSFWLFFFRGLGLVFVVGAIIFIVSLFTSCAPEPIEELDPAYYYTDSATIAQDSIMKILEAQ